MSRISPLKDYRDAGTTASRKQRLLPPRLPILKSQIYERQEEPLDRSKMHILESRVTPQKVLLREPSRDLLTTKPKDRLTDNLEYKIESILKHNSHLLNQNAALGQLLQQRNSQLEILQKRLETQMNQEVNTLNLIQIDKNKFIADVEQKLKLRDIRIQQLERQCENIKDAYAELENLRVKDLSRQKEDLVRLTQEQLDELKKSHMHTVQLYDLQHKKLRQSLDAKQHQIQSMDHAAKLTESKLLDQIAQLQQDLKHLNQMRELELDQRKLHYDNVVEKMARQTTRVLQTERSNNQTAVRKLKKEIGNLTVEVQRLNNKVSKSVQDNQIEYNYIKDGKERVEVAMTELQKQLREDLAREKQRLNQLANSEIQVREDRSKQLMQALQSQNKKIYDICHQKAEQIDKLHKQLQQLRKTSQDEIDLLNKLVAQLKAKLQQQAKSNLQQVELLKIKMAQLFTGDIKTLSHYYQNQIAALSQQLVSLNKIHLEDRHKLQRQLEEKGQVRRALELELAEQKKKVAELRLKITNAAVEMRGSLQDIGTKNQLTSSTLLRQAQQKQANNIIAEDQKKKLYQLIKTKDTEIQQLNQQIARLKNEAKEREQRINQQLDSQKKAKQQLDASHKKQREFFDKELKKKESIWRGEKQQLENELSQVKQSTYQQLKKQIAQLRKQNLRLTKQLQNLERHIHSKDKQLAIHKDHMEIVKMESSVALEQNKDKAQRNLQTKEANLKSFYQQTLDSKNKQIEDLHKIVKEKDNDMAELIVRYKSLEKKLEALLEAQKRLTEFQNKVVNLGSDANLLKNMAEMIKSRR